MGELVADASRVTALRAHQGDEVERAKVNLEELLQVVRLHGYLRTPRSVALLEVQPGGDGDAQKGENNSELVFNVRIITGEGEGKAERRRKKLKGWKEKGKSKVSVSAAVNFQSFSLLRKHVSDGLCRKSILLEFIWGKELAGTVGSWAARMDEESLLHHYPDNYGRPPTFCTHTHTHAHQ